MKNKVGIDLILVGLIIGGISYWLQPFDQMDISTGFIPLIWSIGAFLGSVLLMLFVNEKPHKIALFVSLGVALAVLLRIIFDTIFYDSTSHNLAPFEIIICGIITIPSAFAGVYIGLLIKKLKK